jgi:outer membrane protein assembly factor BamB
MILMKSALWASIIFSLLANIFEGTVRADWPQFRGVNSSGIAAGPAPPIQFGPGKNELWRVPIGVGHSSPCIVGQSIFLTTFNKKTRTLAVVCLDRSDGEVRWTKGVPADGIEKGHPSFNPASSTPACDGERVVAYFGSYGLICFDIAGAKQWDVKMKLARSFSGNATSPIIVGDKVILYRGNYVDHFLMAVDKRSGKDIWKVKQPERFSPDMAGTSTPIVAGDKLIVHSARAVQAVDIETGKQIWKMRCSTTATSTPVVAGDDVIVATWHQTGETSQIPALSTFEKLLEDRDRNKDGVIDGKEFPRLMIFHRSEGTDAPKNGFPLRMGMVDRNEDGQVDKEEWSKAKAAGDARRASYEKHGLLAIDIDSEGEPKAGQVRRLSDDGIPEVPSPLVHDEHVYFVKNGGILSCLSLKTGERVYRMRTRGRGTHYASPLIADGKLFTTAGAGQITVLTLRPDPEILAVNDMEDGVYATPAIVDGTIYVRTHSALFAFR